MRLESCVPKSTTTVFFLTLSGKLTITQGLSLERAAVPPVPDVKGRSTGTSGSDARRASFPSTSTATKGAPSSGFRPVGLELQKWRRTKWGARMTHGPRPESSRRLTKPLHFVLEFFVYPPIRIVYKIFYYLVHVLCVKPVNLHRTKMNYDTSEFIPEMGECQH